MKKPSGFKVGCMGFSVLMALLLLKVSLAQPLVALTHVLIGWAFFPGQVLSGISFNASLFFSGVVAFACTAVIFHAVFRRMVQAWRWRHTFCVSTMVGLLFCICLCTVGLGEQTKWLLFRKDSPAVYDAGGSNVILDMSTGRQILTGVRLHMDDHEGKPPATLGELEDMLARNPHFSQRLIKLRSSSDLVPEPWIYLGYPDEQASGDIPVLISPRPSQSSKRIVGFADSSVQYLDEAAFAAAMLRWHAYQTQAPTKPSNHSPSQPATEEPAT